MDASAFLPEVVPAHWSVYWEVDDPDLTVAEVEALGCSVVIDAVDTPYGRLATVADPAGAQFKLREASHCVGAQLVGGDDGGAMPRVMAMVPSWAATADPAAAIAALPVEMGLPSARSVAVCRVRITVGAERVRQARRRRCIRRWPGDAGELLRECGDRRPDLLDAHDLSGHVHLGGSLGRVFVGKHANGTLLLCGQAVLVEVGVQGVSGAFTPRFMSAVGGGVALGARILRGDVVGGVGDHRIGRGEGGFVLGEHRLVGAHDVRESERG